MISFRIGSPGYRRAAAAIGALWLLAGCGSSGSSSKISDVERAVQVRSPDSSHVRCEARDTTAGKRFYRCHLDVPVSVREMRPEMSCYTFEHGRLQDVTRHVSC